LPRPQLKGVYHVSAEPINKFVFLKHVAEVYGKDIVIEEDKSLNIDRSLDSSFFRGVTEYCPQPWPELIKKCMNFNESK
jgi:dTDP-4-dehydrorhamnose reductase